MELNGWASPQMLRRHASACSDRTRRSYDRITNDTAVNWACRGTSIQPSRLNEISALLRVIQAGVPGLWPISG